MPDRSPPSVSRTWLVGIGLVYILVVGYSVIVLQQLTVGLILGVLLVVLYLLWWALTAMEAIADA